MGQEGRHVERKKAASGAKYVTERDLDSALQKFQTTLMANVQAASKSLLDAVHANIDSRVSRVENLVAENRSELEELRAKYSSMEKRFDKLEKKMCLEMENSGKVENDPAYDHPPNYAKLLANVGKHVSKEQMQKCVGEWLQQDFKDDGWVLQGPERMGKNWSIFFKGAGSSG
eukprot:289199-Karenia_brevis.AAC.1